MTIVSEQSGELDGAQDGFNAPRIDLIDYAHEFDDSIKIGGERLFLAFGTGKACLREQAIDQFGMHGSRLKRKTGF